MSTYVKSFEKLPLPAITICNKTAFKNSERNVEWNSYMENTLDLSDFLVDTNLSAENFTIKTSLTIFYGRCYTIHSKVKIAKFGDPMIFRFKAANELMAYVHEPGFELWLIHGYYPEALKPDMIVKHEVGITDFSIQKSISDKANCVKDNCVKDSKYNQYQCLKEEYQHGFEKLGINKSGYILQILIKIVPRIYCNLTRF
jgi:hypothetical protein